MRAALTTFIKYPILGNALIAFLLFAFFGWYMGFWGLKTAFFPERSSKRIIIQVAYYGASPEEMEEGVTVKIEEALKGVVGIDKKSVIKEDSFKDESVTFLDRKIALKPLNDRTWGFGIVIAGHKKSYYKVPENIRIWYGDDYLVNMNIEAGKINYVIDDLPIFTKMSTTSDLEEFNEIKEVDKLMYDRTVKGR